MPILQAKANEVFGFATLIGLLQAQRSSERGGGTLTPTLRGSAPRSLPQWCPPTLLTTPCHSSSPSALPVLSSSSMVSGALGGLQGEGDGSVGAAPWEGCSTLGGCNGCSTPGGCNARLVLSGKGCNAAETGAVTWEGAML